MDNTCDISEPVSKNSCVIVYVQQDRDKLKPVIMCHTSTYQFLRPCLLVITWLLFVKRWATHTSTPSVYVHAPLLYSTADATASELGRKRRSRSLTCSNGGNLPRVRYQQKSGGTRGALAAASINPHVLCADDSIVRTRRLCVRGGAQP